MMAADTKTGPVDLHVLPDAARFSLRIPLADLAAASDAFGAPLPQRIGQCAEAGQRSALKLGPDEWVLYSTSEGAPALIQAFAALRGKAPHSLVDISDREVSIAVYGPLAADLLSTSCPRDLSAIPAGTGTRTLFDTVPVILTRRTETAFRLEVWRSYFPHVWALLNTANRELSAGL